MNRFYSSRRKGKLERNSKGLVKKSGKTAGWEDRMVLVNFKDTFASSLWEDWHSLPSRCFHSTISIWPFHFSGLYHLLNAMEKCSIRGHWDPSSSQVLPSVCILITFSRVCIHPLSLSILPCYIEASDYFHCFTLLLKGWRGPPTFP